jgi:hypothetical protein
MQRVNKESVWSLLDIFYESWLIKSGGWGHQSGDCITFIITEVIYSYKIMPLEISNNNNNDKSILNRIEFKTDSSKNLQFSGFNLPSTADYTKWGKIISNNNNNIIIKPIGDTKALFHITLFDNYNFVEYKINDVVILNFTDEILNKNKFRRTVDNKKIFDFVNGEIVLKRKKTSLLKIEKLKNWKKKKNLILILLLWILKQWKLKKN